MIELLLSVSGVIGLITGIIVIKMIIPAMFPFVVVILRKRQGALIPIVDRGKIKLDKRTGLHKLFLLWSRKNIMQPKARFIHALAGSQKGGLIILFSPSEDEYYPTTFKEGKNKIEVITEQQKLLIALSVQQDRERFQEKDIMQKYGTLIMTGMVFGLLVLILILGGQYLTELAGKAATGAAQQQEFNEGVLDALKGLMTGQGGQNLPSSPPPP